MSLDELLKSNVADLVREGKYNHSYVLDAIKEKKQITGFIQTCKGFKVLSTSIPFFKPNGEIDIVVSTSAGEYEIVDAENSGNHLRQDINTEIKESQIVAESLAMKRLLKICRKIAPFDCRVLLYGETGTGKEVLAKYIHQKSKRSNGPFISVNCAAIPENLFESEFFGYEKGAFTGANSSKRGLIEIANNGTLFLDEISELPLEEQSKLLRVLETQEVRRIGGTTDIKVDFRLIAATNKDLKQMVERGTFREDLYYRINVILLHIPPLRERPLDIIGLVRKFTNEFNDKYQTNCNLTAKEFYSLLSHTWPGNVRELKNYVERLLIANLNNLNNYEEQDSTMPFKILIDMYLKDHIANPLPLKEFLAKVEEQYIHSMIEACNGKIIEASNKLGIHRTVLYRKMKNLNTNSIQNRRLSQKDYN
ncbi:MAG: sigma-54-dependent Fis family transcriptional regulator [Symbiobacterium thermophilum]|uniref:Sigma-54-dependent Fis family transcriptional regulator n=2 Tax=Symbiobacterium thermophilum TaxID=2734 RepID=A0A953LG98_SYMTR|nr:sigma-54-dependent Fis family transcriptional regulator [Symbiobacterium thermophilum]